MLALAIINENFAGCDSEIVRKAEARGWVVDGRLTIQGLVVKQTLLRKLTKGLAECMI